MSLLWEGTKWAQMLWIFKFHKMKKASEFSLKKNLFVVVCLKGLRALKGALLEWLGLGSSRIGHWMVNIRTKTNKSTTRLGTKTMLSSEIYQLVKQVSGREFRELSKQNRLGESFKFQSQAIECIRCDGQGRVKNIKRFKNENWL